MFSLNRATALLFLSLLFVSCMPEKKEGNLKFEDKTDIGGRAPSSEKSTHLQEYTAQLGDRIHIGNILLTLFGPNGAVVRDHIHRRMDFFQGGCDIYEGSRDSSGALDYDLELCSGLERVSDQVGVSNVVREGYRVRACHLGVTNNTRLDFAINAVGGSARSIYPTRLDVQKVLTYFYPLESFEGETLNLYEQVLSNQADSTRAWQLLIFSVCATPEWQLI